MSWTICGVTRGGGGGGILHVANYICLKYAHIHLSLRLNLQQFLSQSLVQFDQWN